MCYKFLITLLVTPVSYERNFSKLKYVETYLRNSLSQENLESFMTMTIEKELLSQLDPNHIIDIIASKILLMIKLLKF